MEINISTHAPAQGATGVIFAVDEIHSISTHAPAQGATTKSFSLESRLWISTHAPAQGATLPAQWRAWQERYFNPRPRTGGDPEKND